MPPPASTARSSSPTTDAAVAHLTFHARNLAVAARATATDCLIATRRADDRPSGGPSALVWRRSRLGPTRRESAGSSMRAGVAARHASLRSVWFINSLRGALALAAAVSVADLTDVQHGFWVVLGTLSVLRTNAASTGRHGASRPSTGTVAGFVIGSALLIAIGSATHRPVAGAADCGLRRRLRTGYRARSPPGRRRSRSLIAVLFNLLRPVGWKVGVVRVEDVAIGCGVSLIVGVLFWPRGAAAVVGDDLADAFRHGASYLLEAVNWVLGSRHISSPGRRRRRVSQPASR